MCLRLLSPVLVASLAFASAGAAFAQTAPPAPAPAAAPSAGPVIVLAPEDRDPPNPPKALPIVSLGSGVMPDADLVRSLTEQRFRSAVESIARTSVGGYGELTLTGLTSASNAPREWTADARRLVLFVAHSFTQDIRAYTEFEFEHAREAEVEQAYIDWKVAGDYLGIRAGLILVPMGITNEVHEPPMFNGVSRPSVETVVIPSTWREIGAGFFGRPTESLHYELYAMAGLDPLGFTSTGFRDGSGAGALSNAKAWVATGRVEYEPVLGVVLGASGYAGEAGKNANFFLRDQTSVDVSVPVFGYSLDARVRRSGLECKILYTEWRFPTADVLMHTYGANGLPNFPDATNPVPSIMRGAYVEAGYDVFHPFGLSHQLVPFVRFEAYDTQAAVPQGFAANPALDIREITAGASYRPLRAVVLKADYLVRYPQSGPTQTQISTGIGFMY
jgi:hypothetical protein